MTFANKKLLTGQVEVVVLDIYLDQNDVHINFSSDPGSYNTPKTTASAAAYNPSQDLKLYRFSNVLLGPDAGPHFPILDSFSTTPPVLNDSIGLRASLAVTLSDVITNDVYELPVNYSDRRVTGSFIAKWLARNYLHNRPAVLRRGFDPQNFNLDNFISESYIIEKISGPDVLGKININCVDPLVWASRQKSKIPKQTNGNLTAPITTGTGSFTLTDVEKSTDYSSSGYMRFNKEIIKYVRNSITLPTMGFVIQGRGEWGTEETEHAAGDTGQECFFRIDINVVDIILSALNEAELTNDLIDLDQFADAKATTLSTHNYTGILSKPGATQDLIKNLLATNNAKIFWNTSTNLVNIKHLDEFDSPGYTLDALRDILPDTLKLSFSEKSQITRQQIIWALSDATSTDEDDYAKRYMFIDDIAESPEVYGKENESNLIKSNWLPSSSIGDSIATGIAQLNVEKGAEMPIEVSGVVDIQHIGPDGFFLADFIQIKNIPLYTNGALVPKPLNLQVTKLAANDRNEYTFTAIALSQTEQAGIDYIITTDQENLYLTDIAPPIAGRETVVLINAGVTIGATSISNAALTTGSYPNGLLIRNRGLILGMGGRGESINDNITSGVQNGGPALALLANTTIDNGAGGLIWGGGAGGAASLRIPYFTGGIFQYFAGSGGGGGQGYGQSLGGIGDPVTSDGTNTYWPGGDGQPGNSDGPGEGGLNTYIPGVNSGYIGGEYGEDSLTAVSGYSIITNSQVFSIIDGNNSYQIKGPIL